MDAPTEWTYGGLIDWSSADKLKLLPVQLPLRCVIEAIRERYAGAGLSLPEALENFNPLKRAVDYMSAIQGAVSYMIQGYGMHNMHKYLKHTAATGGEFAGLDWGAENFPVWSEADMLAEIGAEKRLSVPAVMAPLSADWFFQQYQLLNLMRWLSWGPLVDLQWTQYTKASYQIGSTPESTWSAASGEIDGMAWGDYWTSSGPWSGSNTLRYFDPSGTNPPASGEVMIQLKYTHIRLENKSGQPGWPSPLNVTADLYARCSRIPQADAYGPDSFYQALPGVTLQEDKVNRLYSTALPAGEKAELEDFVTTYSQPPTPPMNETRVKTFEASIMGMVSKFDTPGGFKFVA